MEAAAGGLPLVSTRHSGIPELVRDDACGLLADEHNVDQLVEALQRLLTDPELVGRLTRNARNLIEEEFSIDALNEQLVTILKSEVKNVSITVCALTYKRPEGLERLLEGLATLEVDPTWKNLSFVIVDNCPDGSAKTMCEAFDAGGTLAGPLKYVHQPIQGIARSRNAALDAAASSEWTAFIDDDERPEPSWLVELYKSAVKHEADVVGGPGHPHHRRQS